MHRQQIFVFAATAVVAATLASAQQPAANPVPEISGVPTEARTAAAAIDAEKIRANVRFLSLDLLEGRGPGTRGAEMDALKQRSRRWLAGGAYEVTT